MRVFFKIRSIVLVLAGLIFSSHLAFAQGIDPLKYEIYSKLKCCPCKESFETCTCAEAKEMKAYIDGLLESGISKKDIFYKVAKKFYLTVILDKEIKADLEKQFLKEKGGKYSRIIIESAVLDFGVMSKKMGRVSKTVRLYNKGNTRLVISNLRVSCDCTSVSLKTGKSKSPFFGVAGANPSWQGIIEQGNSGELEVALDLNHSSMGTGKQIRDVFVSSNDIFSPEFTLRTEIEIQE